LELSERRNRLGHFSETFRESQLAIAPELLLEVSENAL
jgi:hypothetical protein